MSKSFSVEESALQIFNEGFNNSDKALKKDILFLFEQYGTNSFTIADTIKNIKYSHRGIKQNKVLRVIQDMLNENILKQDNKTKKIYIVSESDQEDDKIISDEDQVLEYFNTSVSGSITGINFTEAVKAIKEQYGISKPKIIKAISKLIKDGKLQRGQRENTIIVNSLDSDNLFTNEEDEEGNILPSIDINLDKNQPQPLTNQETPETLKNKGWTEVSPGVYTSPDKKSTFILTPESTNNKFQINKNMSYTNDYDYELLREEFEEEIDNIESFDANEDNTDGLDEFTDTEEDLDETELDGEEEEFTVTLTKNEVDILKKIISQFDSASDVEEEDIDMEDEDDFIDDEATDEEATDELVDGEDDFDEEDEEDEEEDIDIDIEEDAEELAGSAGTSYDGSFSNGAPTFRKGGNTYGDRRRKPIEGTYKPHTGTAFDGTGRNGSASFTKHSTTLDRGGKPVKSKQTSGTGKSLFDL